MVNEANRIVRFAGVAHPVSGSTAVAAVKVGDPSLKPEKSKGYTLGLVWDPLVNTSFVRLLKLTAYYQEPKKNMVTFEDRFEAATRRANENLEKLSDDD